jgi:hypothetical protein
MHTGKRQLHLGLDAGDLRDVEVARLFGAVMQQGGLPDACFAPDDDHPAVTFAHVLQEPVEHFTFAGSAQQRGRRARGHL